MTPAELLADSLAAHRLTRLVTADTITQPLRDRALAWLWTRAGRADDVRLAARLRGDLDGAPLYDGLPLSKLPEGSIQGAMSEGLEGLDDPPKLVTLITCRWCAGVYVAAAVTVLRATQPRGWRWVSRGLACASAAALWAHMEDR